MLQRETAAYSAKAKKPLSDLNQIRQAIKALQKDASEQLTLELESQATFVYFNTQLTALKQAFETLSDVLLAEVENVRKDTSRRLEALEVEIEMHKEVAATTAREFDHMKRSWEVWSLKERDWAKDNEILKASHSHNVEWMQTLQRDVIDTKDRVHELRHEHALRAKEMADEAASLRVQWHKQTEVMTDQLLGFDNVMTLYQRQLKAQDDQRIGDISIMEKALSSLQKQQLRLSSAVDEGFHHCQGEIQAVWRQNERMEVKWTSVAAQVDGLHAKLHHLEREQTQRMENVSSMFSVFADALNVSVK
ncbi:hypothetical protein LEN26_013512 [Aphanomyces euteiches]|nr:hypothetical protein AeMF1_021552 [Aphanomyces euteiches]KAH9111307.1 hypothetical protein LEN26_013512 [Aphanomyces euteiches]KAH9190357.1 hypothetical protein AeNC1_007662 [Aphanomyces euteiches]